MWPREDWQQGRDCLLLLHTFNRYFLIKTIKIFKSCYVFLSNENMRRGKGWVWTGVWWGLWRGRRSGPPPPHLRGGSWAAGSALTAGRLQKHVHYQRAHSINYLGLTQLKTNQKTNFGKKNLTNKKPIKFSFKSFYFFFCCLTKN